MSDACIPLAALTGGAPARGAARPGGGARRDDFEESYDNYYNKEFDFTASYEHPTPTYAAGGAGAEAGTPRRRRAHHQGAGALILRRLVVILFFVSSLVVGILVRIFVH